MKTDNGRVGKWPFKELRPVGEASGNEVPKERYARAFETLVTGQATTRAGVWECTACAETVVDETYDEIVVLISGSRSFLVDANQGERFEPGDCFLLGKGFCGEWRQHETVKIFHMTGDPQGTGE